MVSPIPSVLAASKLRIFAEKGLKMLFSGDLQGFLNQSISSKALIHKQMELFRSMTEQKLPPGISLRGYLSSPAWVTMFTTRRAATAAALGGRWTGGWGVSRQSGSGCTTCLHLPAAIPKVNFQEETQTDELLTFQVDLLESIGSPAGGTVQSKRTAHLLTLNIYIFGGDGGTVQALVLFFYVQWEVGVNTLR